MFARPAPAPRLEQIVVAGRFPFRQRTRRAFLHPFATRPSQIGFEHFRPILELGLALSRTDHIHPPQDAVLALLGRLRGRAVLLELFGQIAIGDQVTFQKERVSRPLGPRAQVVEKSRLQK